ncbi:hypothetical protein FACS1894184_19210 [Clostridia bacterium]|nr:hypothetical protein FACS1894184_19210 [Clostridia bacterium]
MSKEKFGAKLGVPTTTIRHYIRDPARIRTGLLLEMLDELKIDDEERLKLVGVRRYTV